LNAGNLEGLSATAPAGVCNATLLAEPPHLVQTPSPSGGESWLYPSRYRNMPVEDFIETPSIAADLAPTDSLVSPHKEV